jgi:hypothetical protein
MKFDAVCRLILTAGDGVKLATCLDRIRSCIAPCPSGKGFLQPGFVCVGYQVLDDDHARQ